jgi:hypothetical protein
VSEPLKHFDPEKVTFVPMLERLGGFTPASEMGLVQGSRGWEATIYDNFLESCKHTLDDGEECGALVEQGQRCVYCGTLCPEAE